MPIEQLINQILQNGLMTFDMEIEIHHICDQSDELSLEEYMALERLREAMLAGEITVAPRKKAINALEEVVMNEILRQLSKYRMAQHTLPDLGDILAYALNRLPPLYSTTQEGAQYQRQKAQETMLELIKEQVQRAIEYSLVRPDPHPERRPIQSMEAEQIASYWLGMVPEKQLPDQHSSRPENLDQC